MPREIRVDQLIEQLKEVILNAKEWELSCVNGKREIIKDGSAWKEYEPNGTKTITIKINGGAMDT
jgi:hypothetical protein